jgi:phosphatidyl-myo-inositol alpha-mannosyltransferase
MKIALVSEYYYPDVGGMPEHVYFMGRQLIQRGHEVEIITGDLGADPPNTPNGIPVVRVGRSVMVFSNGSMSRATVGINLAKQVREALHDGKYDLVHVHSPTFPVLPMLAIKNAPRSAVLVGTLHTHFEPVFAMKVFAPFVQGYMDALDGVIAVAETAASSVRRYLRFDCRIIPTGIDLETFGAGRRLPELDDGKLNIGFLARLEPRNDVPRLLQAFNEVRRHLDNVRLVLIGDGPLRPYYEQLIDPSVRGDVVFAGQQITKRPDYLASFDVFCFTARIAASPVSLREGMGAGCACIANDIKGCDEVIEHERDGLLIPRDGVEPLVEAILRLLRNPEERARLGRNARLRMAEYDWPVIARRTEAFYEELVARRRGDDARS